MQQDGRATVAPGSAEDGGLSVAAAAAQLGISTDAVRRRLKAGELTGHQRPGKHGPAWCVHPDEPPASRDGPTTVIQTVAPGSPEGDATLPQDSRQGGATVAPGSAVIEGAAE